MPNKLFPTGIDPLNDLIQLKRQLAEHTDAIIQLQENQNELIKATNELFKLQSENESRITQLMIYIAKNYEKIKDNRNSTDS